MHIMGRSSPFTTRDRTAPEPVSEAFRTCDRRGSRSLGPPGRVPSRGPLAISASSGHVTCRGNLFRASSPGPDVYNLMRHLPQSSQQSRVGFLQAELFV
ncbi:unnamed protein product [Lota lota]